jgi:hypothetical protein
MSTALGGHSGDLLVSAEACPPHCNDVRSVLLIAQRTLVLPSTHCCYWSACCDHALLAPAFAVGPDALQVDRVAVVGPHGTGRLTAADYPKVVFDGQQPFETSLALSRGGLSKG